MKLSGINYGAGRVQSLGRKAIGLPGRNANILAANAGIRKEPINLNPIADALDQVSDEYQAYEKKVSDNQKLTASNELRNELADWEAEFLSTPQKTQDQLRGIPNSGAERIDNDEVFAEARRMKAEELIRGKGALIGNKEARSLWSQSMGQTNAEQFQKNRIAGIKNHQNTIKARQKGQIKELMTAGKFDEAKIVAKNFAGSLDDQAALSKGVATAEKFYSLDRALLSDNTVQLQAGQSVIENADWMGPKQKLSYQEKFDKALKDNVDSRLYKETRATEARISDFRVAVASGQKTETEIEAFFEQEPEYTAKQRTTDIKARRKGIKTQTVAQQGTRTLEMATGSTIDPKQFKDSLSLWEQDKVAQAEQQQQPVNPYDMAEESAARWGIITETPTGAFKSANLAILNNNSAQALSAVNSYMRIMKAKPGALEGVKLPYIERAAALMEDGVEGQDAIEQISLYEQQSDTQKDAAKLKASQFMKLEDGASMATAALQTLAAEAYKGDGWYGNTFSNADLPTKAHVLYQSELKRMLPMMGNNIGAASRYAFGAVQRKFQETEINGTRQLMENAPPTVLTDRIRQDLDKLYPDIGPLLISDIQTQRDVDAGRPATYQVIFQDDDPNFVRHFTRFTVDTAMYAKQDEDKRQREHKAEAIEMARTNAYTRNKTEQGPSIKQKVVGGVKQTIKDAAKLTSGAFEAPTDRPNRGLNTSSISFR